MMRVELMGADIIGAGEIIRMRNKYREFLIKNEIDCVNRQSRIFADIYVTRFWCRLALWYVVNASYWR